MHIMFICFCNDQPFYVPASQVFNKLGRRVLIIPNRLTKPLHIKDLTCFGATSCSLFLPLLILRCKLAKPGACDCQPQVKEEAHECGSPEINTSDISTRKQLVDKLSIAFLTKRFSSISLLPRWCKDLTKSHARVPKKESHPRVVCKRKAWTGIQ